MLSLPKLLARLRRGILRRPARLLALLVALSIAADLLVGFSVHSAAALAGVGPLRDPTLWQRVTGRLASLEALCRLLFAAQLLIAGALALALAHSTRREREIGARAARRSRARMAREVEQSQALLERLSIATQAAGIYCWELDWQTYEITFDASRLPPSEVAAASRRHFGAELGSDLFKWVHPDDQHIGGKTILEALDRGDVHASFRYRIVLPDQSVRHVQACARTYCDPDGKPRRSLGVSWDITAEVEAAESAARNAASERAMLERLSVATQAAGLRCWEFDFKQGRVVWLDQGLDPHDASPEAIAAAGAAMFAQILPEDDAEGRARTGEALERKLPMLSTHARRRDADGALHHVQLYQRLFYDEQDQPWRAVGAMLDITESFQRQAELEALSVRFSIATRAANAGVWEYSSADGSIWWNETMYSIYGCSPQSFRPTLDAAIAMIHPDDLAIAQAAWDEALQRSNQLRVEFRIVRPDGSIAHVLMIAAVISALDKLERRLVGIAIDMSERVAAEQRERRLQKQLREAFHQAGMAEVATGVLHNVGNVLNSLGVAASTAQACLKSHQVERVGQLAALLEANRGSLATFMVSDERGRRLPEYLAALGARLASDNKLLTQEFQAVSEHVDYLRQIIHAQQSFARMGGAHESVDVGELIEVALTLKAQSLKGVEVVRDFGKLPPVLTDRYKLLQIIVNFIANACDAIAMGGSSAPRVAIRVRSDLGQLEIEVEDSGVGIAPELVTRIWEFGFTTKPRGHGFGLHSAALAARQLGGSVSAHSDGLGRGARFSVKIPLDAAAGGDREAAA